MDNDFLDFSDNELISKLKGETREYFYMFYTHLLKMIKIIHEIYSTEGFKDSGSEKKFSDLLDHFEDSLKLLTDNIEFRLKLYESTIEFYDKSLVEYTEETNNRINNKLDEIKNKFENKLAENLDSYSHKEIYELRKKLKRLERKKIKLRKREIFKLLVDLSKDVTYN